MGYLIPDNGGKAVKLEHLLYYRARYNEIEHHEAFKDFIYRITSIRNDIINDLQSGRVDKYGKTHDNESRACLYVLNTILSFVPDLNKAAEIAETRMVTKQQTQRTTSPIFNSDTLLNNLLNN